MVWAATSWIWSSLQNNVIIVFFFCCFLFVCFLKFPLEGLTGLSLDSQTVRTTQHKGLLCRYVCGVVQGTAPITLMTFSASQSIPVLTRAAPIDKSALWNRPWITESGCALGWGRRREGDSHSEMPVSSLRTQYKSTPHCKHPLITVQDCLTPALTLIPSLSTLLDRRQIHEHAAFRKKLQLI